MDLSEYRRTFLEPKVIQSKYCEAKESIGIILMIIIIKSIIHKGINIIQAIPRYTLCQNILLYNSGILCIINLPMLKFVDKLLRAILFMGCH